MNSYLDCPYLWMLLGCIVVPVLLGVIITIYHILRQKYLERQLYLNSQKVYEKQVPLKRRHVPLFKSGYNYVLNKIEKETGTKIAFIYDNLRNPERQLLITGTVTAVNEAYKMIRKVIQDKSHIDMYEMGVAWETMEKFMGKENKVVNEIQSKTGTNIMIRSEIDHLTGPFARVIITGSTKEISKAVPLVEEKIKFYERKDINRMFGKIDRSYIIPELKLLDLLVIGPEIHLHVLPSSIRSPDCFFVQIDTLHDIEAEDLNTQMKEFYSNPANLKMLQMYDIKVGQIVASKNIDGMWQRCEILEVHDTYCVFNFIDTGVESRADIKNIYELPQHFLKYIVQAYQCALFNIGSPEGGWTDNGIERFKELCDIKSLEKLCMHIRNTKIILPCRGSTRKHLHLVDLYNKDMNIGTKIRREKHAIKENSMGIYYRGVPKSEEEVFSEHCESFKMYKEVVEDLDEDLMDSLEDGDLLSDDDFEIGDHNDLNNFLSTIDTETDIIKHILTD